MSMKYLGETFDIHAGGIDHIPIHHTNEIAQSEAATGKHPSVNYWLHNEFLVMDKGKMSKSAGGFLTLQNVIEKGFDPLDYRYFILGGHYRSQLQFSWTALEGAKNSRKSLMERIQALAEKAPGFTATDENHQNKTFPENIRKYLTSFDRAMEEDLATPRALAELWGLLRDTGVPGTDISGSGVANILEAVLEMDKILGLDLKQAFLQKESTEDPVLKAEIGNLINERAEAKKAKNFARADEIRDKLKERGIILTDSAAGTSYKLTGCNK